MPRGGVATDTTEVVATVCTSHDVDLCKNDALDCCFKVEVEVEVGAVAKDLEDVGAMTTKQT